MSNPSIHDSASNVNDPIPQNVIDTLAAVRESGLTNMFARSTVISLADAITEDAEAVGWLIENKSRYMEALEAMGDQVSR